MGGEAIDRGFLTVLKGFPLFSALQEEQLKEVAETAKLSDFDRDKLIVREGDRSTDLYVVLKGLVEIRHGDLPLARLGPGQFFGETALVSESIRSASVIAIRPTSCLVLSGAELRSYPAMVVKLLEETTRRNRAIVLQSDLTTSQAAKPVAEAEAAIGFKSDKTKVLFEGLVRCFTEDYMLKRLYLDQAGWRTIGELSAVTKIPHATLYGEHGKYGAPLNELLARGLIETRVFSGQRGRGGEAVKARIAYEREPVKRYVDRVVLKRKSE